MSKDTKMYPMWAKYWILTGFVKLSKFNLDSFTFGNRDKGSVAPFAELNREALSYVMDAIIKKVNKKDLQDIQDPDLIRLLDNMNFGKLYAYALKKAGVGSVNKFKTNKGEWVLYKKDSDHMPLVNSLQGHNTGWCTAGEATAAEQLSKGDFHVYYSLDDQGQPTLPRVAIRMESSNIAEVRGVGKDQNLDEYISKSNVVESKMKEFGSEGTKYQQKDQDMKLLTKIENKYNLGQSLNKDELDFLYELKRPIEGFGYNKDPRIQEIKMKRDLQLLTNIENKHSLGKSLNKDELDFLYEINRPIAYIDNKKDPRIHEIKSQRDSKSDLVIMYENKYSKEDISTTREEALSGKFKIHFGYLGLSDLTSAQGLKLPQAIDGSLNLDGLTSPQGLELPEIIFGELALRRIGSVKGLKKPKGLRGYDGPKFD
ncbi:MAG: hypothetical protein ACOYOK_02395 [Pseudobdellovibrionaceae bacterium]